MFSFWLSLSNWFRLAPVSFLFAFFSDEKGTRCHVHSWKQKWNYSHFFYAFLPLGLKSIPITTPSPHLWMDTAFWKRRKSTCQSSGDQNLKSSLNSWEATHTLGLTCMHPWKYSVNSRRQAQPMKTMLWGLRWFWWGSQHLAAGRSIMKPSDELPTWAQLLLSPP